MLWEFGNSCIIRGVKVYDEKERLISCSPKLHSSLAGKLDTIKLSKMKNMKH